MATHLARWVLEVVEDHAPESVPRPAGILPHDVLDGRGKLLLPRIRSAVLAEHRAHVVERVGDVVGLSSERARAVRTSSSIASYMLSKLYALHQL